MAHCYSAFQSERAPLSDYRKKTSTYVHVSNTVAGCVYFRALIILKNNTRNANVPAQTQRQYATLDSARRRFDTAAGPRIFIPYFQTSRRGRMSLTRTVTPP